MRILLAEDEKRMAAALVALLRQEKYDVDHMADGAAALIALESGVYDIAVLDVMMPGMSGFELARRLKNDEQTSHIPIIFLTAKDTEDDTLLGFGLGADDYVTKPFSVREVVARVKAVLNRSLTQPLQREERVIRYKGLVLDLDRKTTTIDGETVNLTRTEFELLRLLLQHRGQVFSRQQIFDAVWPEDVVVSDRTVDVNITRIRKKIGAYGSCVVSRHGFGYFFENEE